MATKPTREQDKGCNLLADALLAAGEAARLDGRDPLDLPKWRALARALASATTAFTLDDIVGRAMVKRARGLGLPSTTADLLSLVDDELTPLDALMLDDERLRDLVAKADEELGDI
jgi:hypothetical protein